MIINSCNDARTYYVIGRGGRHACRLPPAGVPLRPVGQLKLPLTAFVKL